MAPESTGYSVPQETFTLEGGKIVVDRTTRIKMFFKPEEFRVIVEDRKISRRERGDLGLTPDARRIKLVTPPDFYPDTHKLWENYFYNMRRFREQLGFIGEGRLQHSLLERIGLLIEAGVILKDSEIGIAFKKTKEEQKK